MVLHSLLQTGSPGGPELVILLLIGFLLVIPFVIAYWVYKDADNRGEEHGALWALVAGLASFLGTPIAGLLVVAVYYWQLD